MIWILQKLKHVLRPGNLAVLGKVTEQVRGSLHRICGLKSRKYTQHSKRSLQQQELMNHITKM